MNPAPTGTAAQMALLHELFAAATHEASVAMCRWTGGVITLELDAIDELPIEDVAWACGIGEQLLTMVALPLAGELGGDLILTVDDVNGRQLAATLLNQPLPVTPQWTPLEQSALEETGNILGCAYVNALTRAIGHELVPLPPQFMQDYGGSVLQQALLP